MSTTWLEFALCALCIVVAGARLSYYGDIIAIRTHFSRSAVGMILLAFATSLPELVAGVSAVAFVGAPDIAVANVLGSCMVNLSMLALIDFLYRPYSLWRCASDRHALAASLGVVMAAAAGIAVLLGQTGQPFALRHVGVQSLAILLLYVLAVRSILTQERARGDPASESAEEPILTLRAAATRYAAAAAVILAAGSLLPTIAAQLANQMGWHDAFVGSLFVAGATTLPELAVTVTALRIGALDLAIGNLLGSNLFNLAILAVDDLAYIDGSLWAAVAPVHAYSALSVTLMSGLALAGLAARPASRLPVGVSWISIGLIAAYGLNGYVLLLLSRSPG